MAQIIPPITSLPLDSIAAPSAEDIQDRLPSICVDYLSHDWSEEDVWASWRSMTRHKHEIANGVRLENASWRTWQKQRNKLKTISPETLNWLKDSDVTWLYGPLHTAHVEPVRPLKVATADERLGIDLPNPSKVKSKVLDPKQTKPILKHRTLSEMLTIPMPSSPILEHSSRDEEIDPMDIDGNRPILHQTRSDTNIPNARVLGVPKKEPLRMPTSGDDTPVSGSSTPDQAGFGGAPPTVRNSSSHSGQDGKRHISFNTFVEQVIAIDEQPRPAPQDNEESDEDVLEMKSNSSKSSRPSFSRNSSTSSSDHITIAKIAPAMLKTNGSYAASNMPQMVYAPPPEYQSPSISQSPNAQFDFPSPKVSAGRREWSGDDEDEYDSVGYDYFRGPNLSGEEESSAPSHVGTSYGRAPTVNQPPPQPKWRQPAQQAASSEPSSVSSTSSSTGSIQIASPPVPSRGILKVRPPGSSSVETSSPPQSSYFNYTPSAATGFGAMRGSYEQPSNMPVGSPLVSPATEETRGRSAQRAAGSTAYERSASRNAGSSPATSLSPGAAVRTPPLDAPRGRTATSPQTSRPAPAQVAQAQQSPVEPPQVKVEDMDVDEPYQPERSNTPTPHSSPQV